jgi:hypothetical protein
MTRNNTQDSWEYNLIEEPSPKEAKGPSMRTTMKRALGCAALAVGGFAFMAQHETQPEDSVATIMAGEQGYPADALDLLAFTTGILGCVGLGFVAKDHLNPSSNDKNPS